jgi:hypothetical protein
LRTGSEWMSIVRKLYTLPLRSINLGTRQLVGRFCKLTSTAHYVYRFIWTNFPMRINLNFCRISARNPLQWLLYKNRWLLVRKRTAYPAPFHYASIHLNFWGFLMRILWSRTSGKVKEWRHYPSYNYQFSDKNAIGLDLLYLSGWVRGEVSRFLGWSSNLAGPVYWKSACNIYKQSSEYSIGDRADNRAGRFSVCLQANCSGSDNQAKSSAIKLEIKRPLVRNLSEDAANNSNSITLGQPYL